MRDDRAVKPDRSLQIRDDIENDGSHGRCWQAVSGLPTDLLGVGGKSNFKNVEEMGKDIAYARVLGECGWRREKVGAVW